MVRSDKAEQLQAFLSSLPETLVLRLAKAVEVDRLAEGNQLPHELILEGLRPVLRKALKADRTPTPRRLFCRPFEDLLTSAPRREKSRGRIARSSVAPVWDWLSHALIPDETTVYCAQLRDAVLSYRLQEVDDCAARYWELAANALHAALAGDTERKSARLALGGEQVLADADEMAILLSVGPQICELQDIVRKPQYELTADLLWTLRGHYDHLAASRPDAAHYVAVVVMNRLLRPWEALRLPLMVARQTQDTLISSTDMGMVGELLLSDLDSHASIIRTIRQPMFDAGQLIDHLSGFALLSQGMVKEVELRRDGKWGQRLLKDRAAVAEIMDDMMKRAPREILAAMPTLKSGAYAGGPRVPDLSRPFDEEKAARAHNYAQLITGCRSLAQAASFGASLGEANDEVCVALKAYCEDLVRELRAAEGERLERASQYFALAVELVEMLFSPEEGEFLRRRGKAAVTAQAAA